MSLSQRDGQLVNNWYVACLSTELKSKKPLACMIYDRPLVLFRNRSGQPSCLPDRCLHRHAKLSAGVVIEGHIACPYHGWVYDSAGKVVTVPSEGEEEFHRHSFCLPPLPTVEQDGCVWVWLGSGAPVPALPPFRFPYTQDRSWTSYFMVTDFDNEVVHLAENFMDVPHTVFVHQGWFRSPAKKKIPIQVETQQGKVLVTYEQPRDTIGFSGMILNPKRKPMIHTDCFILPNLTRVDYSFGDNGFVIISQITPVTSMQCRVYTAIIYRVGSRIGNSLFYLFLRFYTRRVIEQDVAIMAIQGANLKQDMTLNFHATAADIVHTSIERLRELAAQGNPLANELSEWQKASIWI